MEIGLQIKKHSKRLLMFSGLIAGFLTSLMLMNLAFAQGEEPVSKSGERVISIFDRGEERVFVTKADTVRKALKAADIEINDKQDVIEPSLDSELVAQKYSVNIYRARPITVVDGKLRTKLTTAEQTPELIAKVAKIELYKEDKVNIGPSSNLLVDGADTVMNINRATPVVLTAYGKKATVRTQAKTVGELLTEKKLKVGKDDTLSVSKDAKIVTGMSIELWRNGKQTVTVEEEVDFPVEKIQDANREVGYREVKQAGEKGKRNATYEIIMKNGEELSRKELASVMTKEPKKQVEVVGAKNVAMPYTGGGSKTDWLRAAGIPQEYWGEADWLVQKESGWNPNAVNSSSGACGLAQALPCYKVPGNPYNPVDSLRWMNGYVNGRYGGWGGAVNHFRSAGWY